MSRESIEVFRALKEENMKYWIAILVSPIMGLFAIGVTLASTLGLILGFFYLAIFVQSIRGVMYTARMKKKLQQNPSKFKRSDVRKGPVIMGIPGIYWFVSLTR
ncbi:hypothetical protein [Glaciecola sp. 1036]|uniref:hypothetical protein n=1 Tax=Alteromonadaceae TaxID=72275 RepID=UPI003D05B9A4